MQINSSYECKINHLTDKYKQAEELQFIILQCRTEMFTNSQEHRVQKLTTSLKIIELMTLIENFTFLPNTSLNNIILLKSPVFVANLGSLLIFADETKKDVAIMSNTSYNIQINIS